MKEFYKGPLVWPWQKISKAVNDDGRFVGLSLFSYIC